jgi:hypothetical protein
MGRMACTESQCLYKGALYLIPVQTLDFMSIVVMSIHICQYYHYRLHNPSAAEEKTILCNLQPTTVTQMLVTKAAFCLSTMQLHR